MKFCDWRRLMARKHLALASLLSVTLAVVVIVFAVVLTGKHYARNEEPPSAAELLMVRPSAAATPVTAENAVRIDRLLQHVDSGNTSTTAQQEVAAKRAVAATHKDPEQHSGASLKSYYAQLVHKKLLPTVQEQCQGFVMPETPQLPPLQPATSKQPNFIYLLIDDMGYDDLHMHHPQVDGMHNWVKTPHLDKIVRQGKEFTNFYTTPMCSTSRAELLTGRYYPRTASMYINSGWDFMNSNETLMGEIFGAAGYKTAHFGKWHNGRTAGYMPSDAGFEDTYEPTPYVHYDNLFTINDKDIQTQGYMEDNLMNYAIQYLQQREVDEKPFLLYYPTFSVHAGWMTMDHAGPRYQRPAPPKYLDKFLGMPLSQDTAHLYAMLEHIDDQIGRLMDWLDQSDLAKNTFVFLGGDNGPALFGSEQYPVPKEVRMPSGMQGSKHEVKEGGIRNFLAVRGPGIPQGSSSNALTALIDIIPTLVDMAGIKQVIPHAPWDGISFANLVRGEPATLQQQERMYITMETQCTEDDFVPLLGPDRHVKKPQPLLDYTAGGVSGLGFKRCVGVRYKNYKWLADASEINGQGEKFSSGTEQVPSGLYKFHKSSHVERKCQEVSRSEPDVAAKLEAAAADWWQDMLNSKHSFERVTFYLGLGDKPLANVVADGAIQRTPGRVQVTPMGVSGFEQPGDASWYRLKVATGGTYDVSLYYQSRRKSKMRVWVGSYDSIKAGTALHLDATLDSTGGRTGIDLGSLKLPQTPAGETWEIKLEMISNSKPGKPAVIAVDVIVFKLQGGTGAQIPVYQPDLQEGVKAWKMQNGYGHIHGMEPVATVSQKKQQQQQQQAPAKEVSAQSVNVGQAQGRR